MSDNRRYVTKRKALHPICLATVDEIESLHTRQEGRCAICNKKEPDDGRRFAVDHCHTTGKLRGILCGNCNRGIGFFHDSTTLLRRAAFYLRDHGAPLWREDP